MTGTSSISTLVKTAPAAKTKASALTQQSVIEDPSTAGLFPVGTPTIPVGSTVLAVGVGKRFATLAAAIAASHDGNTILVDAGTYTNDFATITTRISIIGVGGMVNLVATIPPPNLKGILTVDNDVSITNLAFSGCAIPDDVGGNGAGIRYEGGRMVLVNDSFSNNQNGILGSPVLPQLTVNTISIDHSVFSNNGSGTGFTHNLYIGAVDSLTVTNSIFQGAVVGHELKSRALVNDIEGNVFRDGPAGTASYDIDLPNGGVDTIRNNTIEKGPNAQNNAMVHFGGEGIPYAGSSLTVTGNSFINDKGAGTVAVLNQTAISVAINSNTFRSIPASQIVQGPATGTGNTDDLGNALPDINLAGVIPGNTIVFTDANPHSVVLTGTLLAVQGGGGLLTVSALAGHVTAIGGTGGMNFTEGPTSGGNTLSTAAGSVNAITVVGQDLIDSKGTDRIIGGAGNLTGQVAGKATIDDGSGDDKWTVNGTATITGHGGNPVITVGPLGNLTVTGPLGYLKVQNNGGTASFNIVEGGIADALSIAGGAVDVKVNAGQMSVTTAAGANGSTLRLGAGTAQVISLGSDIIWAGSGAATIIVSGHAEIHAGTGTLSLYGRGDLLGATFYGNGGDYLLGGDTGNITYYGGTKASTVRLQLSNNTLIGGTGRLTINGGSRETITGGSGGITYAAIDGGGANTITTMAGAIDTLTLAGADVVNSHGQDTIMGGSGNQTMAIYGTSTITGSTGNSVLLFYGHGTLTGQGQDLCTVYSGAILTVRAGRFTSVDETGGTVNFTNPTGPYAANLTVRGGAALISGGTNTALAVTTKAGMSTQVTLGGGPTTVSAYGSDSVTTGTGPSTITIAGANARIFAGAGAIVVHNRDGVTGDQQTVRGSTGAITYDQGAGALSFTGGSGAAIIDGGWGSMTVTGGAGNLAITNGGAGMRFIGGSGHADLALTPGGGDVTFGTGSTTVQVAAYGAADLFHCLSGQGGGTDLITGFRSGIDRVVLQGVAVVSTKISGGATDIILTDNTHLHFGGLTDASRIFG
jgi:hypothetical protein